MNLKDWVTKIVDNSSLLKAWNFTQILFYYLLQQYMGMPPCVALELSHYLCDWNLSSDNMYDWGLWRPYKNATKPQN